MIEKDNVPSMEELERIRGSIAAPEKMVEEAFSDYGDKKTDAKTELQQSPQVAAPETKQINPREEALREMDRMIAHFSPKGGLYDDYDRGCVQLENLRRSSRGVAMKGWGIVLIIVGVIFSIGALASGVVGWFFGALLMISGPGVLMVVLHTRNQRQIRESIQTCEERLNDTAQEIVRNYNAYGHCSLGLECTYPDTLMRIREIIRLGRTDSISGALNILIQDAQIGNINAYAMAAADASRAAANASRVAAAFSVANFFINLNS